MSERTIAEIIGIRYAHHCSACECDPSESGVVHVDEILDWLKTQPRFGSVFYDPAIYAVPTVQLINPRLGLHADTLLEVLEWAVRKIDEEKTNA